MTPFDHKIARNDRLCIDVCQRHPNKMVSWYLMASYAYYHADNPILSDGVFDQLCRDLLDKLCRLEIDHPHMFLCDPVALGSGTGFQMALTDYPPRAIRCAQALQQ